VLFCAANRPLPLLTGYSLAVAQQVPGRILKVGHRGAPALAPENTLRSLELAVELGCDVVEFDVLDLDDGTLVLAHSDDLEEVSHGAARGRVRPLTLLELREVAPKLPTLDDALAFMGEQAPWTGLHVDIKSRGYEEEVVSALRRHGAVERAVASSFNASSVQALRRLEPRLARGLTYPHSRFRKGARLPAPIPRASLALLRAGLPRRIGSLLRRAGATAAMLHHEVVTPETVEQAHAQGASVFAWTVDDADTLARMVEAGVDGVITNDPRILGATL
jgi:glycerophosphoryl diester phosphodiesterase